MTDNIIAINREPVNIKQLLEINSQSLRSDENEIQSKRPSENIITTGQCRSFWSGVFPFIQIMRNYQTKWLMNDILGGVSTAVVHIPMGLGYSVLIGVPPVLGLYTSIYAMLVYFVFGTSLHLSMGPSAVISLLLSEVVDQEHNYYIPSESSSNLTYTVSNSAPSTVSANEKNGAVNSTTTIASVEDPAFTAFKVDIVVTLTFLIGIFQISTSCLRFGAVAELVSLEFLNALMVGASFHVTSSQLPFALGISKYVHTGKGASPLYYVWSDIITNLYKTNYADVVCSGLSLSIVIFVKEFISRKFKHKLKFPIPIDLIVALCACLISMLTNLSFSHHVRVAGHIPRGLIAPKLPAFTNSLHYVKPMIFIGLISFVLNISLGKTVGKRHPYIIKDNQELFAYGVTNLVVSMFRGYACGGSPPRSFILDSLDTKTLVSGLVAAACLILVCFVLAPVFEYLPLSCVAAIVIASSVPLLKQYLRIPKMFRTDVYDCGVWIITCFATIITNVQYGLIAGLAASCFAVLLRARLAKLVFLQQSQLPDVFFEVEVPCTRISEAWAAVDSSTKNLFVIKYTSFLFFGNISSFIGNLQALIITVAKVKLDFESKPTDEWRVLLSTHLKRGRPVAGEKDLYSVAVILDCSAISYVDTGASFALKNVLRECKDSHIYLALAGCTHQVLSKVFEKESDITDFFYPTILDAVEIANLKIKKPVTKVTVELEEYQEGLTRF